jgi:hypothetical protein
MPTSEKTDACYTGLNDATVLSEVRTISGLPSRMTFSKFSGIMNFFWILTGLREFWVIATVLRLAVWALIKYPHKIPRLVEGKRTIYFLCALYG